MILAALRDPRPSSDLPLPWVRGLSTSCRSFVCPPPPQRELLHLGCPRGTPVPSQPHSATSGPHSGPLSSTAFRFSCPQQKLTFFNSTLNTAGLVPEGEAVPIPGAHRPGVVTKAGLLLFGNDDQMVTVLLQVPCPFCRLKAMYAVLSGAQAPQEGSMLHWRTLGIKRPQASRGETPYLPPSAGMATSLSLEDWPPASWVP